MENTVLIDTGMTNPDGEIRAGIVLYGYRQKNTQDKRIRIITIEQTDDGFPTIVTRLLIDSEDYDGQSGIYEVIEIDSSTDIHAKLDAESNSGWLEAGATYRSGKQEVITLTANELLSLSGSFLTVHDIDRSISY